MAYCDTLYNIGNIVGYTGQLYDFPTVYFKCDVQDVVGHITQKHDRPQNIGRQEPMPLGGIAWRMKNKLNSEGRLVGHEYYGNFMFHQSRHFYTEIGTAIRPGQGPMLDMGAINILAQALRRYPDEKQMSAIGDRELDYLDNVKRNKDAVMAQLQNLNAIAQRGQRSLQNSRGG